MQKPGTRVRIRVFVSSGGALRTAGDSGELDQFTIALRFFSGRTRTFLLAGFSLNVMLSRATGCASAAAFVAGFLTALSALMSATVSRTLLRRLFLTESPSESNVRPTSVP